MLCGAKLRGKNAHCQKHGMLNGRCRLHGGLSPKGKDHWNYRHGCSTKQALENAKAVSSELKQLKRLVRKLVKI